MLTNSLIIGNSAGNAGASANTNISGVSLFDDFDHPTYNDLYRQRLLMLKRFGHFVTGNDYEHGAVFVSD